MKTRRNPTTMHIESLFTRRGASMNDRASLYWLAGTVCLCAPAAAQEPAAYVLSGGIGHATINANEFVYSNTGDRISHLIWEARTPVAEGQLLLDLSPRLTLSLGGSFALGKASGHMQDYDWAPPHLIDYAFENWTHRSVVPATALDHHYAGELAFTYALHETETLTFNIGTGVRYTDTQWTGYGGTHTYSVDAFRDRVFSTPDDERSITYRTRLPVGFISLGARLTWEKLRLSATLQGGLTPGNDTDDFHWSRNLYFHDIYAPSPYARLSGRAELDITPKASLYLAGSIEQHIRKVGDTIHYDIETGGLNAVTPRTAGMDFGMVSLSGGLQMRF